MSNSSNIKASPGYAAVFGGIMTVGLPLNALALWILLRRHSLKSPCAVFMINLALSDLLLVITLPMRVYYYATGTWPLGEVVCMLITILFRNNIRSSSIFMTFISMDRLLAVVYPLRSRHLRTSSNAVKGAVLVWMYVLGISIPESLSYLKELNRGNESLCFESIKIQNKESVTTYWHSISMCIKLAVNIVCTVMVSWTLYSHLDDSAKVKNKVNVMVIFIMNLIIFTICFIPLSTATLRVKGPELRPMICLATINCCLDPLLYYFSLDAFWKKKEEVVTARGQKSDTELL